MTLKEVAEKMPSKTTAGTVGRVEVSPPSHDSRISLEVVSGIADALGFDPSIILGERTTFTEAIKNALEDEFSREEQETTVDQEGD